MPSVVLPPLNLTIDGEKVITDGVAQTTTSQLIREWNMATSPRVNGGWIAKGWRNGHCYSESRDTLAEAVNGLVAQIEADERTLSARGAGVAVARWAFDGTQSGPTEWPDDLSPPTPTQPDSLAPLADDVKVKPLATSQTSEDLIVKWSMSVVPVTTMAGRWVVVPDGGFKRQDPTEHFMCWRASASLNTSRFVFTSATLGSAVFGLAEELESAAAL